MRFSGCLLLLWCVAFCAAAAPVATTQDVQVVRAWFDDPAMLGEITPLLGHAQVDRAKGLLRTEADPALRARLIAAGMRVEVDAAATAAMQRFDAAMGGDKSIPNFSCYRTVEESYASVATLIAAHPDLVSLVNIGQSWQASQGAGGYPMRVVRVTNSAVPGPKPILFLIGSIHAREYTPAELVLRFVEELVNGYGVDADATWIVDHHEIQVLVQGNPDGRKRAETGLSWRKNVNNGFCPNGNNRGIDLNRNFPFVWGEYNGSSGVACEGTFRGPSAASEPETQAIISHVRSIYADRRGPLLTDSAALDTTGIFADIHSYSQLVLWPWGFIETPAPNRTGLAMLGRRIAGFNDYTAEAAIGLYPTDGTTDDFAYGELGVPSFTLELGTEFFQSCSVFENQVLPDNRLALRYMARALRAPYVLPAGPDAHGARVTPDLILSGDPAVLSVQLDDARQQSNLTENSGPVPVPQPIASARAYVEVPPWQGGATPIPMAAADGAFNSPVETATVSIPTTGLATGKHLVFAQGRDSGGADGIVGAAFVEVLDPALAATVEGRVSDIVSNAPVAATLSFGEYTSESSAASGAYERLLPAGAHPLQVSARGYETQSLPAFAVSGGDALVRDFALYRVCPMLTDAAEIGQASPLVAQTPWQLRDGQGQGGSDAWLQSSGASYGNNLNASLTSAVINLTGYSSVALSFEQRCQTEAGWDFGLVEISTNGGGNWTEVFRCDGESAWRTVELPLPQLDGAANARLRFRFTSDTNTTAAGWALDNIALTAGGPTCRAGQLPVVRVDSLSATPPVISSGDSTTIAWTTSNADSCQLTDSLGSAPIALAAGELDAGSRLRSPVADVTYTLACSGDGGPASRDVAVDVQPLPPVAITAFASAPTSIVAGASSNLAWTTQNASACRIGNNRGQPEIVIDAGELGAGNVDVTPTQTTAYTLSCDGVNGPALSFASVTVTPAPPAPTIVSFTAAPGTIGFGDGAQLQWSVQNADACSMTDDAGGAPYVLGEAQLAAGTREVAPMQTTSYTLDCSSAGGAAQRSATLTVVLASAIFDDGFESP